MEKNGKPEQKGNKQSDKRSELEYRINMEIVKDPNFLKKLKENPHKALQQKFGIEIPSHIKIHAHTEEPNSWHFVIRGAALQKTELSPQEMGKISAAGKEFSPTGDCWV